LYYYTGNVTGKGKEKEDIMKTKKGLTVVSGIPVKDVLQLLKEMMDHKVRMVKVNVV